MKASKTQRQLELEQESVRLGVQKYQKQVQNTSVSEMPPGIVLMHKAIEPMVKALEEFKKPARGSSRTHQARKFLKLLDSYEIAYITSKILINSITETLPVQKTAIKLTKILIEHYEYTKFMKENPNYLVTLEKNLNKRTSHIHHRKKVIMQAKRKIGIEDQEWTDVDKLYVGAKLIDLFIENTGLLEKIRMTSSPSKYSAGYILKGTETVKKWVQEQHARCELLSPLYQPMLVPPVSWNALYGGGFLTNHIITRSKLIKTRSKQALDELENHDMPLVYRAVNALQDTAWRINRKVLAVMEEVWSLDNGLGEMPRDEEEPLPVKPWGEMDDEDFKKLKEEQPDLVKGWKRRANEVYERRIKNQSRRFQTAQKLWIANKFKNEAEFYFVWSMDWRGRLYPVQPNINPQADDSGKALLEFAEGKPLGEHGAYWLAVQLANKFGVDKVSFDERIAWVQEHEDLILDSALNPLTGRRFWDEADDPWQFLAACFEWQAYKQYGSASISRIPIAMDGSCNGLQNFSAMLLDDVGGAAVNLTSTDKPQDIYQEVCDIINRKLQRLATEGDEMAQLWLGKVDRSLCKRPVMTIPYGVSAYGISNQILDELAQLNENGHYLDAEDDFRPALYLAELLYDSIGEVVIAAREAMNWLQKVAKIANKYEKPLSWVTPVGFKVYQFYAEQLTKDIRTFWGVGRVRVRLSLYTDTNGLNKRKQTAGISPNFVHSMDASHLMLTVNKALDEGIKCFAMVHDSYATHAADTCKLGQVLRKMFVEQYSSDVLAAFAEDIKAQLPDDAMLPPLPKKGKLRLDEVLDAKYFFA